MSGDAIGKTGGDFCRNQFGQSAPEYNYETWHAEMLRRNSLEVGERTMTEDERIRFLRAYNNSPPITDVNPERIEMFWVDDNPYQIAVVFVENGCVTFTALMARPLVDSIISPNTNGRLPRFTGPQGHEA